MSRSEVANSRESRKIDNMDRGDQPSDDCTTLQAARLLGVSVRSIQLMVDRGELEAWKTSGGHRRIARDSVDRWRHSRRAVGAPGQPDSVIGAPVAAESARFSAHPDETPSSHAVKIPRVLLIEDSIHFQKLVSMLISQHFPRVELHVAGDGIAGLAQYGVLQPDILIVDILLPGIDGAALITSLRSNAQFANSHIAIVTSLDETERAPYGFAIDRLPLVHKSRLVAELPALLKTWLD